MSRNELLNVGERIRRWKEISSTIPPSLRSSTSITSTNTTPSNRRSRNKPVAATDTTTSISNTPTDDGVGSSRNRLDESSNTDPFDCTELVVPPTYELVQNVLKEHVEHWKELDSRLIVKEAPMRRYVRELKAKKGGLKIDGDSTAPVTTNPKTNTNNNTDDNGPNGATLTNQPNNNESTSTSTSDHPVTDGDYAASNNWVWNQNRIKLPDFFDYTCKGDPPQPPLNPNDLRRKVISLDDPTQHLDYECELWKIFKDVPLATDIEKEAVDGHICVETMKIRNEIEESIKEYSRIDAHALSRLRKRDRHHWPRVNLPLKQKRRKGNEWVGLGDICGATIRVECWRRQLKRGSGCDPNRCEVELLESQTLLDLHDVLTACSQDDLFTYGQKLESKVPNEGDEVVGGNTLHEVDDSCNGYFFIEDTFYTHGDVDYVTPIIEWLNEEVTCDPKRSNDKAKKKGKNRKKASSMIRSRKEFLGIDRDLELKIVPMKEMKLVDLSFRLASRYVHVFNGDCESAILFSDVSMRMSNENMKESQYPLVHDIFTTTTCVGTVQESATCQACERGSAIVMTLNDELADGGPTLFCAVCYAKLHYKKDGSDLLYNNFEVIPLSVLQNLRDLCVGNDTTDALF